MFIVPFKDVEIEGDSIDFYINDEYNYIINFLFEVIEGPHNIHVSSVKRDGLGLRVKFLNKSGAETKIRVYRIFNLHILATNHNSHKPIIIGNTYSNIKIPLGYSEYAIKCNCTQLKTDLYNFNFKVISGAKQVYVSNVKIDSIANTQQLTIGFYNAGGINSYLEISTLEEDFLVGHDRYPPPKEGIDLKEGSKEKIYIENRDFGQVKLKPSKDLRRIIAYTFEVREDIANVYVCGQYYDHQGNLVIDFYNEAGQQVIVDVYAWETYPYGG